MPAPTNADALLDCVRKSQLVDAEELAKYADSLRQAGVLRSEPKTVAARLIQDGLLTTFQARELLQGHYRGFYIGNYRVLEPLGTGGMSRVFLCEHATMGHRVAMKVVPAAQDDDPSLIERFLREARANGALNHPNVVRAHDFNRDGKHFYLIMDYVEGVSLHDLVRRGGPLSPTRAANYITQAAQGLMHLQESGLVHRDVKPANLLLDRQGIIRILDLGLARFLDDGRDALTEKYDARLILGTADYLSPEQATRSHEVDIRSDIYSLGATFYYLLAGRTPFEGKTVPQKLLAHQMHAPDSIQSHRPEVPDEMAAVVHRMLEKEPRDRYPTPNAVIDALKPWAETPLPPPADAEFPSVLTPRSSTTNLSRSRSGLTPRPNLAITKSPSPSKKVPTIPVETISASERKTTPLPAPPRKKAPSRRLPLVLVGLVLFLGVGASLAWYLWPEAKPNRSPSTALAGLPRVGPRDDGKAPGLAATLPAGALGVTAAGGENTFRTVREALAAAPAAGGRILLLDPTHEEHLLLSGPMSKEVTVESAPGAPPTVWRMPASPGNNGALIGLNAVAGFRLKGVILDGGDRLDHLVHVAGACPGTALEEVTLQGFTRSGVVLAGCTAETDKPMTLTRLRMGPARSAESGVSFETASAGPSVSRHIRIIGCRFEGLLTIGLLVNAPTQEIEFRHNRLANLAAGVCYRGAEPKPTLGLTVANNTFFNVQKGLHFESSPLTEGSRIAVTNNFFVKTSKLALLDGVSWQAPRSAEWFWSDEGLPKAKETQVADGTRYFRAAFDVAAKPDSATLDFGCAQSGKVWLNGQLVAQTPPHFTKRVYAFDVSAHLKQGRNVLAVEAVNTLDPFSKFLRLAPGLTIGVNGAVNDPTQLWAATGSAWKAAKEAPEGWQQPTFDDKTWTAVKVWAESGTNWPWADSIWDSAVRAQLSGPRSGITIIASGNIRSYDCSEGYPTLDSKRAFVKDFPADPSDDTTFLRYRKEHPLNTAGPENSPVGLPPE